MKTTLVFAFLLALLFTGLAAINVSIGFLSPDHVRATLDALMQSPVLLGLAIFLVLAVDSLLAVPTITTIVLAGYLLGPFWGGLVASLGVLTAGSICYWGARCFGETRFVPARHRARVIETVGSVGPAPLMLSRISPLLPEVLSALAGTGRMSAKRYYLYFAIGNVPFSFLAAWAGSISSLERPWPALAVGVGLPTLGATYLIYRRFAGKRRAAFAQQENTP
ncbi:TVP38/TMEM64 family protein [Alkalilimnicola ehrlichii]|nr:VTT domain-containing protein [Alkalilimnicola ehrlichii]